MTYTMLLNLEKITEWKLSMKACFVMGVAADLESWATRCKANDAEDENVYYLLYRKKILKDLPFLGSESTVSRALTELEEKGLIKSINKHFAPAYCLTKKGLTWKRKREVEASDDVPQPAPKPKKTSKRQKSLLSLSKKTRFDDTDNHYQQVLREEVMKHCNTESIPKDEYMKFLDHHVAKGSIFVNWLSAFRTWGRNYKKYNSNDGESERGLYQ